MFEQESHECSSQDKTLIHRLVSLKPFEAALKLSFGPWNCWSPLKSIIWRKILECFYQKP